MGTHQKCLIEVSDEYLQHTFSRSKKNVNTLWLKKSVLTGAIFNFNLIFIDSF